MVTRTIEKNLLVEEDVAWGEGSVSQTRGGSTLTLTKVDKIHPVDTIAALKLVDPLKYPKSQTLGTSARGDGNSGLYYWEEDATDTPDDLRVVVSSVRSTGRWKVATLMTSLDTTEEVSLASGQTSWTPSASLTGALIFINGPDADNGRLFEGSDYSVDIGTNTLTLTQSYPAGTRLTLTYVSSSPTVTVSTDQTFDTVAQLKAASLSTGVTVTTRGYTTAGDDGGAKYLIKSAADFGGAPDGYGDHSLANGNVAVLQNGKIFKIEQFGGIGNGTTDEDARINAFITAIPSGGTGKFSYGSYLMSGASAQCLITKPMTLIFEQAELLFDNDNAGYLRVEGASDIALVNPQIRQFPAATVRSAIPGIFVKACSRVKIIHPSVRDTAGAGVLVENVSDVDIDNPYVSGNLADGVHVTTGGAAGGTTSRVTVTNPRCYNTGDDGVAVVSYAASSAFVEDTVITGALSVNSGARGLTVIGGKRVRMEGQVYNSTEQGVLVHEDISFLTQIPQYVYLDVEVYSSQSKGVEISRGAQYITGQVAAFDCTGRGVDIGNAAVRPKYVHLSSVSSVASGSIGVHLAEFDDLNIGSVSSRESNNQNVFAGAGQYLNIGSIFAYNGNTGSIAGTDNIQLNGTSEVVVSNISSIDDRGTPLVERAVELINITNGTFGPIYASGGTAGNLVLDGTGNTNVKYVLSQGNSSTGRGFIGTVTAKPTSSHEPIGAWCYDTTNSKIHIHHGSGTWKSSPAAFV